MRPPLLLRQQLLPLLFTCFGSAAFFPLCLANSHAKRLFEDLLINQNYNKHIRPVSNNSESLTVHLGILLSQIIDIDEKNQVMVTNVWLREAWHEPRLHWNPEDYGGIQRLRVPSEMIWLPDLVMFNNADGNYEVTLMTKATLYSTGKVLWEPPAIYKSSCQIDVEFFPFDKQQCSMKFGSWTYHGLQVDLRHILQPNATGYVDYGVDLESFVESTEWDLLHVPAVRNLKNHPCCPEPYPDITFTVVLRRKTLFYLINLIIPCVAISLLTVLVFYLPSESGEKTTLCISVLVALTLFFLVLVETIPATSLVVPLIGKYLLFTMVLVTLSIVLTVIVLNINFRSPSTHRMGPTVRKVFLDVLPRLMRMYVPEDASGKKSSNSSSQSARSFRRGSWRQNDWTNVSEDFVFSPKVASRNSFSRGSDDPVLDANSRAITRDLESLLSCEELPEPLTTNGCRYRHQDRQDRSRSRDLDSPSQEQQTWLRRPNFPADPANNPKARRRIKGALDGVQFIAEHLRDESESDSVVEDWIAVATVIDRLLLWLFTIIAVIGTGAIILRAPSLYDSAKAINLTELKHKTLQEILDSI